MDMLLEEKKNTVMVIIGVLGKRRKAEVDGHQAQLDYQAKIRKTGLFGGN